GRPDSAPEHLADERVGDVRAKAGDRALHERVAHLQPVFPARDRRSALEIVEITHAQATHGEPGIAAVLLLADERVQLGAKLALDQVPGEVVADVAVVGYGGELGTSTANLRDQQAMPFRRRAPEEAATRVALLVVELECRLAIGGDDGAHELLASEE